MSDKDFEVLQTALSPEVSESREQVFYNRIFFFFFNYYLFFILSLFNYDTSVEITEKLHLH